MPTDLLDPAAAELLDAVASLVLVVDSDGRALAVNRAFEEATGLARADVLGRPVCEAAGLPAADADTARAGLARLAAGTTDRVDFGHEWAAPPDGSGDTDGGGSGNPGGGTARPRVFAWSAAAVRDAAGRLVRVVCTGVDRTADRAAAAALREGVAALRDSNERYQALFDATSDAVVMHADGVVIEVNRSCCDMFGYAADELVGRDGMSLVFPPESRARVRRLLAAGRDEAYEAEMRRKDGTRLLVEVRGRTIDYKGRRVRVASNRDVTDRRRAEHALRESEERFRLAVEHSPDVMFHQDADLRFTWISRTVPPITPADVIGRTDADVVGPEVAGPLVELKRRVMRTGVAERVENRLVIGGVVRHYESGIQRRLDAGGRVAGVSGYARDVTERALAAEALRAANADLERRVAGRTAELEARTRELEARSRELARSERELREQGALLRLILDHMGDGVAVADQDGRFVLFNPAAERIIGTRPADAPGAGWPAHFQFYLPDTHTPYPEHDLPLRRALRGEPTDDAEIFVRHPTRPGGVWLSATARPIRGADGRPAGGVTVVRDLTDRRRAADSLRASDRHHRELAERNRWLVREVEHRVGNQLAGLIGLVTATRATARDVGAFADAVESRLRAMAEVHKLVAGRGGAAVGVRDLVDAALAANRCGGAAGADETIDGPDVAVPARQVMPLSMILAEWHANSCKYGAHSRPGGGVRVAWAIDTRGATTWVELRWRERGGPPIRLPVRPSLGTGLVHEFAARELGGRCQMCFGPDGADHLLEFPTG